MLPSGISSLSPFICSESTKRKKKIILCSLGSKKAFFFHSVSFNLVCNIKQKWWGCVTPFISLNASRLLRWKINVKSFSFWQTKFSPSAFQSCFGYYRHNQTFSCYCGPTHKFISPSDRQTDKCVADNYKANGKCICGSVHPITILLFQKPQVWTLFMFHLVELDGFTMSRSFKLPFTFMTIVVVTKTTE